MNLGSSVISENRIVFGIPIWLLSPLNPYLLLNKNLRLTIAQGEQTAQIMENHGMII